MAWFTASIISCIIVDEGGQSSFPIYEDFYLVEANSRDELHKKIKEIMNEINAAGQCNYNGKPAKQKCVGVRKVRSVYNQSPLDIDQDRPDSGTELSHSFMMARSITDVETYASGGAVWLWCVDDSDEDMPDTENNQP